MNNKLLILCNSAYGMVGKELTQSMKCFEQIDVLTSCYVVSEGEGGYREMDNGNVNDYEKYAENYTYAIAVFKYAR